MKLALPQTDPGNGKKGGGGAVKKRRLVLDGSSPNPGNALPTSLAALSSFSPGISRKVTLGERRNAPHRVRKTAHHPIRPHGYGVMLPSYSALPWR